MKITIAPYTADWAKQFEVLQKELSALLQGFNPVIEHVGSTSIPGLAAKPVIDILVGLEQVSQLDEAVNPIMQNAQYIYYKVFNGVCPDRRLFIRLTNDIDNKKFSPVFSHLENIPHEEINTYRMAHIHIWEYQSPDWKRHIAFREYLKAHKEVRLVYESLKKELSKKEWKDGMAYNEGKDKFIKIEESKALAWCQNNNIYL